MEINLKSIGDGIYTKNLDPGNTIYGEDVVETEDGEFRQWDPNRSKLAAFVKKGLDYIFEDQVKILYLGAATGTTVSHISDLCPRGDVYAVDYAEKAILKLLKNTRNRRNVFPIYADAYKPWKYSQLVDQVDLIYQDVSHRKQTEILKRNSSSFLKDGGKVFFMVKSANIDVTEKPEKVFEKQKKKLKGFNIIKEEKLEPYHEDHLAIFAEYNK
ncbi:MAG: Fibrillarin-like rRNA methylase NOP1 [Candidatus Methanohalarchaeum thermophilum]|uniref:Fibrillarin-like rRNA/tRNA 2'-O-methyltransferase n=1 Tax=Methanohalarchaeum thermophilum TaxID=1903181 RepID=A0A1Q6DXK1_METT1|nr:MAG: Fibrillarin-like rRNA methylase NOP1 [Candidatus Methanohalarchaeum thermophilum]